jgi:hypothetical protein
MKKVLALAALLAAFPATYCLAAGGTQANFAGNWVLDAQKTKDVPSRLQSYQMNVAQNAQQITVDSKVEGSFRREGSRSGEEGGGSGYPEGGPQGGNYPGGGDGYPGGRYPGGGYPGGGRVGFPGGGGYPGGGYPRGGGFPGGRRGGGYPGGPGGRGEQMRKGMAIMMVIPKATYNLDGSKSTMDIEKPIEGSATLKAGWKKSGKQLDLSRVEDLRGGERTIKVQEQWSITKDGLLEIDRSVNTPRGSTKVKMFFTRQESTSGSAQ